MGIRCSCGVIVGTPIPAVATSDQVRFDADMGGTREGTLTYTANICADRPDLATLSISFLETDGDLPDRSFTGVASEITSVECTTMGGNCEILVSGIITIGDEDFPFTADFQDQASGTFDRVQSFVITGYFNQNGAAQVPQGSIVNQGCL